MSEPKTKYSYSRSEIDVATTGDILGHEHYETTRIYSNTYKEHLKRAVNRASVK